MSERTKRTASRKKSRTIPMRREYGAIGGRVRRKIIRR